MQEQRTPTPAVEDWINDASVLGLMIGASDQRLWSRAELDREMGHDTTDSLSRLYGGGLVHHLERFYWPTRAARMADEIKL